MECSVEHGKCAVEHPELAGRAKQVSNYIAREGVLPRRGRTLTRRNCSSSPLNGEAATLWDSNMEEFTKKVLARHRDDTDDA